jgi:hypothetical protein
LTTENIFAILVTETIEEIKKMFIVVMPDGETWDTEATIVRVTEEELDSIQDGEKVSNVVDLSDGSVCYSLGVEALNMFLSGE